MSLCTPENIAAQKLSIIIVVVVVVVLRITAVGDRCYAVSDCICSQKRCQLLFDIRIVVAAPYDFTDNSNYTIFTLLAAVFVLLLFCCCCWPE